jgi:two-component system chemotaxis response regulator CheB
VISCPDCGGVLNHIDSGDEVHFRCQVGHAFTPLGLAAAQADELERALGIAVRTHRDRIRLFSQMSANAHQRRLPHAEQRWQQATAESERLIEVLEQAMTSLRRSASDGEG